MGQQLGHRSILLGHSKLSLLLNQEHLLKRAGKFHTYLSLYRDHDRGDDDQLLQEELLNPRHQVSSRDDDAAEATLRSCHQAVPYLGHLVIMAYGGDGGDGGDADGHRPLLLLNENARGVGRCLHLHDDGRNHERRRDLSCLRLGRERTP